MTDDEREHLDPYILETRDLIRLLDGNGSPLEILKDYNRVLEGSIELCHTSDGFPKPIVPQKGDGSWVLSLKPALIKLRNRLGDFYQIINEDDHDDEDLTDFSD